MTDRAAPVDPARLRRRLLAWYDRHGRDLPWRRRPTPYRIWISEVMLVQTQVDVMLPYYRRFLRRFPSCRALARADLDAVLRLWAGLGYYARARHLHAAARLVWTRRRGRLPRDVEGLRALPGIGPYMAAAIASMAFGVPVPAIDGNVRRVITRLHDLDQPTPRTLEAHAAPLVRGRRPGDVNQALMDLAAGICGPRRPRCPDCPLVRACRAHRRGTAAQRPGRLPAPARPHHDVAVGWIRRRGRLLLVRRPAEGLLGGLWELPGARRDDGESLPATVRRGVQDRVGLAVTPGGVLLALDHGYSHFRITLHVLDCPAPRGRAARRGCADLAWVAPAELDAHPLSAVHRRAVAALLRSRPRRAP